MSHFVIRPGQTEYDLQGRISGRLSLPLTELGHQQVVRMAAQLKGADLDAIYTAGTEPSWATAIALADVLDCDVKAVEGLVNFDLGLWQGLCVDEIRQRQPRLYRLWQEAPDAVCPPQGETCEEAYERIVVALKKPLRRNRPFAVVCPEPLATLVSCVLRGSIERRPGPLCGCPEDLLIEQVPVAVTATGWW
jgi:probable phosphoglycerate mutase